MVEKRKKQETTKSDQLYTSIMQPTKNHHRDQLLEPYKKGTTPITTNNKKKKNNNNNKTEAPYATDIKVTPFYFPTRREKTKTVFFYISENAEKGGNINGDLP